MPDRSTLKGSLAALEGLAKLKVKVPQAVARGLKEGAEKIADQADEYCPVEHGNLKGSRDVSDPEIQGDRITVEIKYGGPEAPYAPYVHEVLTYKHPPPTQAKFLERAAREKKGEVTKAVGTEIRAEIETAKNGIRSIG